MPMSAGSKLVTESAALPLESCALRVVARGGVARIALEQVFANRSPDPLHLVYVLPLPADAAVSGFSFRIGDRRVAGEIDRRQAARERYEEAIQRGVSAALLEQDRSSLFTQEIGNVPPGARVVSEIVLDQKLRWLDEGAWEWRFPLAAAPRYLGEAGRVVDAARVELEVARALSPRASLTMTVGDALAGGRSPESPSHPLQCVPAAGGYRVELGGGNRVELDRDVVVHWPVAALEPSLSVFAGRSGPDMSASGTSGSAAHALLTIVPPQRSAGAASVARDLILLIDTSGSMGGAPLDQARRVAMALVDGLTDRDSIELIEFSNRPRRFRESAVPATRENRQAALAWLVSLRASGGTEMHDGILEALRPLREEALRQIVLITDGLIGFEQEIVQAIADKLPAGSRVHTVGVGSSVNRSLTGPAARAGRGVEVVIGVVEDPERAVQRLRARTEAPLVVDVSVSGSAVLELAPIRVPDLYAGAPVLVSARVSPAGGEIAVRGRTPSGEWTQRARIEAVETTGDGVAALFGREAVEDAETRLAAGEDRDEIDRRVETLGLEYRIATRLTSWIAVDVTPSVDPLAPARREVIPQMLPHGMSVDGLGLRSGHDISVDALFMTPLPSEKLRELLSQPFGGLPAGTRSARRMKARPTPLVRGAFTGASSPVVHASIVERRGHDITIEVLAPFDIDWSPESFEMLLLDNGDELPATVDVTRTTRAGNLSPGQVARIVLMLDREAEGERIAQIVFARYAFLLV